MTQKDGGPRLLGFRVVVVEDMPKDEIWLVPPARQFETIAELKARSIQIVGLGDRKP